MQNKRIKDILEKNNCEIAFIQYNKIAFRYKNIRYYIYYENKLYCLGAFSSRYEDRIYISKFKEFKEFKKDLLSFLS